MLTERLQEEKKMSYLVITKISKDKEFFADLSDFADKVNSIKTPEVDLILDNAVLTGDLLSRTYGFQEEATEYLGKIVQRKQYGTNSLIHCH